MKDVGWPKFGAEQIVRGQALLRRVVERVEHVHEQLDASQAAGDAASSTRARRAATATTAGASRAARAGSRWSPCGSATCAVAAHGLPLKYLQIGRDHEAGSRHVDAAHDAEHVRSIVRQPAARVGEIVGIAPERQRSGARRCCSARPPRSSRWRPAGRTLLESVYEPNACQPLDAAFFDGHHEAVVRQRVAVWIRQQKPASGRAVDELEHRHAACRRATAARRSRY